MEMMASGRAFSTPSITGMHAPQLLVLRHDRLLAAFVGQHERAGARGLASDVEDVGAFVEQLKRVGDGCLRLEKSPAFGKRVGRDVDDAHDERARAEVERARAKLPAIGSTHAAIVICAGDAPSPDKRSRFPTGTEDPRGNKKRIRLRSPCESACKFKAAPGCCTPVLEFEWGWL